MTYYTTLLRNYVPLYDFNRICKFGQIKELICLTISSPLFYKRSQTTFWIIGNVISVNGIRSRIIGDVISVDELWL